MGREIKRVPLEFNYPLNRVWTGYINKHYKLSSKCEECDGSGYSVYAKYFSDMWYGNVPFKPEYRGSKPWKPTDTPVWEFAKRNVEMSPEFYGCGELSIAKEANRLCYHWNGSWSHHLNEDDINALIEGGRLMDFTHTWKSGDGWKEKVPKYIPTPEEVNTWSIISMGHDSINSWCCVSAECKKLGYETTCSTCRGEGVIWKSESDRNKYDSWLPTEPPCGDGWQLWETVSEGSPISPVFKTPEELAKWLAESNEYSWRKNDYGTTYEQWLTFIIKVGWAPSFMGDGTNFSTGVKGLSNDTV